MKFYSNFQGWEKEKRKKKKKREEVWFHQGQISSSIRKAASQRKELGRTEQTHPFSRFFQNAIFQTISITVSFLPGIRIWYITQFFNISLVSKFLHIFGFFVFFHFVSALLLLQLISQLFCHFGTFGIHFTNATLNSFVEFKYCFFLFYLFMQTHANLGFSIEIQQFQPLLDKSLL